MRIKWLHRIKNRRSERYKFAVQIFLKKYICIHNAYEVASRNSIQHRERCQFSVSTCFKKYICIYYPYKKASRNSRQGQ